MGFKHTFLIILLLSLYTITNSYPGKFLVDVYSDYPTQVSNPFGNPAGVIYLPFPLNICTRIGNTNAANFVKYQCGNSGQIIYNCNWGSSETCGMNTICKHLDSNQVDVFGAGPDATVPYGEFEYGECPDELWPAQSVINTTSLNYIQIEYYSSFQNDNYDCPRNNDSNFGYNLKAGSNSLITDVCTRQNDGQYLMISCNDTSGTINVYSDSNCANYVSNLITYHRYCDYVYDIPGGGGSKWYRRMIGCFVNGINIVGPTADPTSNPTVDPTTRPSDFPTVEPTFVPTDPPTTPYPTTYPTDEPTLEPTSIPTFLPTTIPTAQTDTPTAPPTRANTGTTESDGLPDTPDETLATAESFITGLDNITLLIVIFSVLFIFYVFICLYIWCNERKKRRTLTVNFQKGQDREARVDYLRQRNRERAIQLQQQQYGGQAPPAANNAHPHQQQLMYEGR